MSTTAAGAASLVFSDEPKFSLIFYLSLLLVVAFIIRRLRQWRRLRHIPGPPLAGFSRWFWLVPLVRSGQLDLRLQALNKKYGKLSALDKQSLQNHVCLIVVC
jgi:hypothetical protein